MGYGKAKLVRGVDSGFSDGVEPLLVGGDGVATRVLEQLVIAI